MAIADGASTIDGIDVLGEQSELFGPIASTPTAWRTLNEIAAGGQTMLDRIVRATNKARSQVWDLIGDRHDGLPGIRVDASLVDVHSEKELAAKTWKKGFPTRPARRAEQPNGSCRIGATLTPPTRGQARVEARIRRGKDTGLARFPSNAFALNQAWMAAALLAATVLLLERSCAAPIGGSSGHGYVHLAGECRPRCRVGRPTAFGR